MLFFLPRCGAAPDAVAAFPSEPDFADPAGAASVGSCGGGGEWLPLQLCGQDVTAVWGTPSQLVQRTGLPLH